MQTITNSGAASVPAFDAAAWLATFTEAGGGFADYGERGVWLFSPLPAPAAQAMIRNLHADPDRLAAVKAEILGRTGETMP